MSLPLRAEAIAAQNANAALTKKAARRAVMNAGANACGNHVPPIIVAVDRALSVAVNPDGNCVKMVCIGLYPRKAAKTAEAGGTCANTASLSCGAPAPAAADANDAGNVEESTKNIMLNMIATPIVLPTFWIVLLIPEAAPL